MEYTQDQIDKIKEKSYIEGRKMLLLMQMDDILRKLGGYGVDVTREYLINEREEAILKIRRFVREDLKEDDDFPDDLHLSDIIDNYIIKNINLE